MLASSNLSGSKNFWLAWMAWMLLILGIHGLTLCISPPVWQDEVQIIDFGRTAIDPGTDWSISWNTVTSSAVINPLYVGGLIQNVLFSLSGYNILFPRLLCILGAIAASTSCLILLISLGHNRLRSAVLSSIFLLDPVFVAGYRGDRIDCWVMAAAFLSCIALQKSSSRPGSSEKTMPSIPLLLASGAIAAIGFSIWFSFVLLAPLIIWQIATIRTRSNPKELSSKSLLLIKIGFVWLLGLATCLFLIQAPILTGQPSAYRDLLAATTRVTNSQSAIPAMTTLLSLLLRNPFLLLLTGISLFLRPRLDFLFFMAIALTAILKSFVYDHRAVYFLPYMILHCSFSLEQFLEGDASHIALQWVRRGVLSIMCAALVTSISISLVLRPINAFATRDVRQLSLLNNVAIESVGKQNVSVLVEPWEFYVPGRKLGWKMYKPYFEAQDFSMAQILEMKYIITTPSSPLLARLPSDKFSRVGDVWIDRPASDERVSAPRALGYGPYLIFRNNTQGMAITAE
jgi:hypothetical protein